MTEMHFLLRRGLEDVMHGRVGVCVMRWLFFDGQHFYSIRHRALWAGGWDSCGRWLCSPGCGFVPVLLWEGLYGVSF